MKKTLSISMLLFCVAFVSCQTINTLSIEVIMPAEILLPSDVKTILFIDRTRYSEKNVYNSAPTSIQKVIGPIDEAAAIDCQMAFFEQMENSAKYELLVMNTEDKSFEELTAQINPLDWNKVQRLCDEAGAQLLISLESFTTDYENQSEGKEMWGSIYVESPSETTVGAAWRIYYPKEKKIIEKHVPVIEDVSNSEYFIQQVSMKIGTNYAKRISPYWRKQRRFYYTNITDKGIGAKKAKQEKWLEAAAIWRKYIDAKNKKIAARACFNMAIACEMQGKLDLAKHWAEQSQERYYRKNTFEYIRLLDDRIAQELIIQKQMQEE